MLKSIIKKFKIISKPIMWFHNHFVIDIASYTSTVLGDLQRRLYIKIVAKKCGVKFVAHTGVQFFYHWNLEIGNNVSISRDTILNSNKSIILKDNVMIGPNCNIITTNHGFKDSTIPMNQQLSPANNLVMNEDVWIGNGVVINSGAREVEIAKGIIIASNSVVNKSLDKEYGIYGGGTCKVYQVSFSRVA
jgi:acetyltransferase-like isoleucine patch superfamily enzyme